MKHWRINLVFILFFVFAAILLGRLIYVQIVKGDYYKALSQGLFSVSGEDEIERGEIFLKNQEPLVINKNFPFVFATPEKIKDADKTAESLSQVLGLDKNVVLDAFEKDTLFSPIKYKLTQEEVLAIDNLKLDGIFINEERGRYYPQENMASQVTGFLNVEKNGQYGLEEYYEGTLGGENGESLVLTIDYNIQFEAEKLLEQAQKDLEFESGQLIVMDPLSGKILAMANFPGFNPNQYGEYAAKGNLDVFQNSATLKFFEPGSVFKPLTMAAALNEGKITPQTKYTDEGKIKIGGYAIYNYDNRVWGERTMTEVLERSINTGAVFAESQLSHDVFLGYIRKFGIFEPTGIDLDETYSENKELKKGYEINFATASFGQGVQMTPIQLCRAYSAIANEGKLVKPFIVEKIKGNEKEIEIQPEFSSPVISQKTASQLTAMLVSVIENGYSKAAKIPGYYIAGKTGTAQVSYNALGVKKEGYSDKTIQTFIGFGPALNPRFLILVKLDNPKTKTAEYSALPIFHNMSKYIIDYLQIPPDYVE